VPQCPFLCVGAVSTDIASGYDHINASIGGALAASFGADFLCYVTPAEHLRHPSLEDVREGVNRFQDFRARGGYSKRE